MKMTLSRNPRLLSDRINHLFAMNDDFFDIDWDDNEMDLYEEKDKLVVDLKIPGFEEKDIDISLEDSTLVISGKYEESEEDKNKNRKYYKKEIRYKSFSRSITLPGKINPNDAKASFNNGILSVELPKAEESKPKRISINVN
jgi:HSP20 family protein